MSECSFKRLPTSFEWLPSDFKWSPRDFKWQSSILDGCRALWALPSVFAWLPNIRLIARRFRVIAGRFENNHQAVSSNRQAFWATVKRFWAFPSVFEWSPGVLRMTVKQFRVIAEDMQRCLCLVRTICSRSVQMVLADIFSFCIWAAFACARSKSASETRLDGFF